MNRDKFGYDIDPWGSAEVKDYRFLMEKFGIQPFEKFKKLFEDNLYVRRGIIFGHRDFDKIIDAIKKKEKFFMITGLMPSGKFHLGHKMVADQMVFYQKLGAKIFICSADIEAYLMRNMDLEMCRRITAEEYLANYMALGLDLKKINFWFQSNYRVEYYRFRDQLSKKVTLNELRAIYGDISPAKIISVLSQCADILHPQLPELLGPSPSVVPVGPDQDPHIRLTRDLASRFQTEFRLILPAATYHKFMRGLDGGKMSSSKPSSYIALSDKPKEAIQKIMNAITGGRATVSEQRDLGGVPEKCAVYDLYFYHLVEDDKKLVEIYHDCRSGNLICGECKAKCSDLMAKFLDKHQKKLSAAKEKVEEFLEEKNYNEKR
ncbi:MAG TPA: tryptophan--tRNA ligase [Candidatus Altiarchaeales archaeon]|nr:tryptophan--tRNA ligase [Candidatus Altiarchaeales archaeon]